MRKKKECAHLAKASFPQNSVLSECVFCHRLPVGPKDNTQDRKTALNRAVNQRLKDIFMRIVSFLLLDANC